MKKIFLILSLAFSVNAFAMSSAKYVEGKKDYIVAVDENTTVESLRDASKPVIVQFSAAWCGPCLMFWPQLYVLDDMRTGSYIIKLVDLSDNASMESAKKFLIANDMTNVEFIPYSVVLAPGETGFKYEGSSPEVMEKLLADEGIQQQEFNEAVEKAQKAAGLK